MQRLGRKRWRLEVAATVDTLVAALAPDYVVFGGGNAKLLKEIPPWARFGDNANAFAGGFRLWDDSEAGDAPSSDHERRDGAAEPSPGRARLRVFDSTEQLFQTAAGEVVDRARAAVEARGEFTIVLSGGSTPRGLYALLAGDASWRARMPWERTHFFWGDERHVPPDHPHSNFRMAHEAMLASAPVPAGNIHRIKAECPDAAAAAAEYEAELATFFKLADGQLPRFDLVLLGLEPEGHTASLYPGTRALFEERRLCVANWVGKFNKERITLTIPTLNNASCLMFLVTGDEKADVFKAVFEGPYAPHQLPAQQIRPSDGDLVWLVDQEAAGV